MAERNFRLHDGKRGAALAVRVTPRASQNEVTEIQGDGTVKVRLTASGGAADLNTVLVKFLAEVLGVSASKVDIVAGEKGNDKLISIMDIENDEVHKRLVAHLS